MVAGMAGDHARGQHAERRRGERALRSKRRYAATGWCAMRAWKLACVAHAGAIRSMGRLPSGEQRFVPWQHSWAPRVASMLSASWRMRGRYASVLLRALVCNLFRNVICSSVWETRRSQKHSYLAQNRRPKINWPAPSLRGCERRCQIYGLLMGIETRRHWMAYMRILQLKSQMLPVFAPRSPSWSRAAPASQRKYPSSLTSSQPLKRAVILYWLPAPS